MRIPYLFLIFFLFISCSDSDKSLNEKEFIEWVEDEENGLLMMKEFDDFIFTLQYKPAEYIVAKECVNKECSKEEIQSRIHELEELYHFNLKITAKDTQEEMLKKNISGTDEYFQRIEYFTSLAENDLKLYTLNDTIDCGLYHFERSYNMAPYSNMVVGFERKVKTLQDLTFSFDEKVLGIGKINFKIEKDALEKLPTIK
ncbi:MAG: hypothetical protein J7604_18110 [Sporocytophaga sp.]|uniref:hypothetical protein n=1 Tax=Sporocytophaga sp. TaxID=2231183 RepID=UPI001B2476EF|nr:hypothetical protein [Sporocytophaga sp.]MBO9702129.1 hypothetical protein [Sporocytophaga sp.]